MKGSRTHDEVMVHFALNGEPVEVMTSGSTSLLELLRGDFHLTGTKRGCEEGVCGVCNVMVDGKSRRACRVMPSQLQGATVTTIEGVALPDRMGPIQSAFVEEGAVGCGFCTPGMVMAAHALLAADPCPSEKRIKEELQPILCRCVGYWPVIRAIRRAAGMAPEPPQRILGNADRLRIVGSSTKRPDAIDKITGAALFADDLTLPGLVYVSTVRSPYPSARIRGIDASSALHCPGVLAVVTAADIPGRNSFGKTVQDQPVLAADLVAYCGQPVALVAAENLDAARAATSLVEVQYEPLPPVLAIQDPLSEAGSTRVLDTLVITRGNVTDGFRAASVVVEETFHTQRTDSLFLEPPAGVGSIDPEGRIVLYVACQDPYGIRRQICAVLSVPEDRIRIVQPVCGGAFGGRVEATLQIHLALAVWKLQRNVKMVYTRSETFLAAVKRHPMSLTYRAGADASGRLTAMRIKILADTGAFETSGKAVLSNACHHAPGPYELKNVHVEGYLCRTNNTPSGAQRGFGVPQVAFCHEAIMDILASKLGISPWEIRERNLLGRGSRLASGQRLTGSVPVRHLLETVRPRTPHLAPEYGKGSGLALGFKSVGYAGGRSNVAQVSVEMDAQGRALVKTGGVEMGQGAHTIVAQIVAEEIGINPDLVLVGPVDTAEELDSGSTEGSRLTIATGKAVVEAACNLKDLLLAEASRILKADKTSLRIDSGGVVASSAGVRLPLAEIVADCHRRGASLRAQGRVSLPVPGSSVDANGVIVSAVDVTFCAARADVEVDPGTGKVKVTALVYAQDVGRAINPANIRAQIDGGIVMGMGLALSEEWEPKGGVQFRPSLAKYHAPRFRDVPQLEEIILEEPGGIGPYGSKGIGELPTIPVAAAIANAIWDAVGVRVRELPVRRVSFS